MRTYTERPGRHAPIAGERAERADHHEQYDSYERQADVTARTVVDRLDALPPGRRTWSEAFGADLGPVTLHTGPDADRLARSMRAKAFTAGRDVYFRHGAYVPGTRAGRRLIAHELTHVRQQAAGPAPPVQLAPERQGDGSFVDPDLPGVSLLLAGVSRTSGARLYQVVETGRYFAYHGGRYHRRASGGWEPISTASISTTADAVPASTTTSSTTTSAITTSPLHPPPDAPSIGTHLDDRSLVRLHEVLKAYGPQVVRDTLRARSLPVLNRLAMKDVNAYVTGHFDDPAYREALKRAKPSLWWTSKDKTTKWQAATGASFDYIGSIGELANELRLTKRTEASGAATWVVRHAGGSGETGVDTIVVKALPDDRWQINCHEAKLSTTVRGGDYGFGKDVADYANRTKRKSGMPEIYRANYDPTGARRRGQGGRPQPVQLHYYHNAATIESYLSDVIGNASNIPDEVKQSVLAGLGKPDGRVTISWKYATLGRARIDAIGVPQTRLGRRSGTDHPARNRDPLEAWLDEMAMQRTIAEHLGRVRRSGEADLKLLKALAAGATGSGPAGKVIAALAQGLEGLGVVLQGTHPSERRVAHLDELREAFGRLAAWGKDSEAAAPFAAMAKKYVALLSVNTSKENLAKDERSDRGGNPPASPPTGLGGGAPASVNASPQGLQQFAAAYEDPKFEGVYRGPSLRQFRNYCGQHAAYNALALAKGGGPKALVTALLNWQQFRQVVGRLRTDIDDLDVRAILDKNDGGAIPVINLDSIGAVLAVLVSLGDDAGARQEQLGVLKTVGHVPLWEFFAGERDELVMVLQTGTEGSNAVDHFIAVKLARRNGKVSLLYLDSLSGTPYENRLAELLRIFSPHAQAEPTVADQATVDEHAMVDEPAEPAEPVTATSERMDVDQTVPDRPADEVRTGRRSTQEAREIQAVVFRLMELGFELPDTKAFKSFLTATYAKHRDRPERRYRVGHTTLEVESAIDRGSFTGGEGSGGPEAARPRGPRRESEALDETATYLADLFGVVIGPYVTKLIGTAYDRVREEADDPVAATVEIVWQEVQPYRRFPEVFAVLADKYGIEIEPSRDRTRRDDVYEAYTRYVGEGVGDPVEAAAYEIALTLGADRDRRFLADLVRAALDERTVSEDLLELPVPGEEDDGYLDYLEGVFEDNLGEPNPLEAMVAEVYADLLKQSTRDAERVRGEDEEMVASKLDEDQEMDEEMVASQEESEEEEALERSKKRALSALHG